jgi:hypothetical protein
MGRHPDDRDLQTRLSPIGFSHDNARRLGAGSVGEKRPPAEAVHSLCDMPFNKPFDPSRTFRRLRFYCRFASAKLVSEAVSTAERVPYSEPTAMRHVLAFAGRPGECLDGNAQCSARSLRRSLCPGPFRMHGCPTGHHPVDLTRPDSAIAPRLS